VELCVDCNVVFGYLFALASKNRRPGVFVDGQEPFVVVQGERGGIHVGVNYNGELCFGDNIGVECTNSMQQDTTTTDTQETTVKNARHEVAVVQGFAGEISGAQRRESRKSNAPDTTAPEVDALSNNKVGVEIEPDVKENRVIIQICSCAFVMNCFSTRDSDK